MPIATRGGLGRERAAGLILVLFGFAEASMAIGLACVLITGGALLASRDMLRRRQKAVEPAE